MAKICIPSCPLFYPNILRVDAGLTVVLVAMLQALHDIVKNQDLQSLPELSLLGFEAVGSSRIVRIMHLGLYLGPGYQEPHHVGFCWSLESQDACWTLMALATTLLTVRDVVTAHNSPVPKM